MPFSKEKNRKLRGVSDYLNKADAQRPIRSSIPDAIESARAAAAEANSSVARVNQRLKVGSVGAVVSVTALIVTLVLGAVQVYSLVRDANQYVIDARNELNELRIELNSKQNELDSKQNELDELKKSERARASSQSNAPKP